MVWLKFSSRAEEELRKLVLKCGDEDTKKILLSIMSSTCATSNVSEQDGFLNFPSWLNLAENVCNPENLCRATPVRAAHGARLVCQQKCPD